MRFQSTLPARGATAPGRMEDPMIYKFQSTLPARGATATLNAKQEWFLISIHAPRTGSDAPRHGRRPTPDLISIHAPRTGSDTGGDAGQHRHRHFNPRSPHGERPPGVRGSRATVPISIHAPRTGSDQHGAGYTPCPLHYFNPRSPHGERRCGWTF